MSAKMIKPVNSYPKDKILKKIFFGGSIEMNKAEDWQNKLFDDIKDIDCIVLNPRRDDWDSSWKQDPTPGTKFHGQVTWELDAQRDSDIIVYYFAGKTMSPITLLELGLHINKNIIVYVDDAYERAGNVIITCKYHNVYCTNNYNNFVKKLKSLI